MVQFASRVQIVSIEGGEVFCAHRQLAEQMLNENKARLDEGLERKRKRGQDCFVVRLWLTDRNPEPVDRGKSPRNSSTTTYNEVFEVQRFNERGERERGITLRVVHTHKPINAKSLSLYGLRP